MNSNGRVIYLKSTFNAFKNFYILRCNDLIRNDPASGVPETTADHLGTIYQPLKLLETVASENYLPLL